MKYLKVFTNFEEIIEPLTNEEAGRLFRAMLTYAETEETPTLTGNERIIWNAVKQIIDRERAASEKRSESGKAGGRPAFDQKQEKANESKRKQTKANESNKEKEKEKDKDLKEKPTNVGKKKSGFQPPTPAEVQAYCDERKNGISGQAFVDWYGARKWMLSKSVQMGDWRAAVRVWEQRDREAGVRRVKFNRAAHGYEQVGISDTAVDRMTVRLDGG